MTSTYIVPSHCLRMDTDFGENWGDEGGSCNQDLQDGDPNKNGSDTSNTGHSTRDGTARDDDRGWLSFLLLLIQIRGQQVCTELFHNNPYKGKFQFNFLGISLTAYKIHSMPFIEEPRGARNCLTDSVPSQTREHDGKDYGGKAKVKEVQQKGEVI